MGLWKATQANELSRGLLMAVLEEEPTWGLAQEKGRDYNRSENYYGQEVNNLILELIGCGGWHVDVDAIRHKCGECQAGKHHDAEPNRQETSGFGRGDFDDGQRARDGQRADACAGHQAGRNEGTHISVRECSDKLADHVDETVKTERPETTDAVVEHYAEA